MATNNAINLKDSGIVSYNGAGTFSSAGNPLTVSNGGQGNSSLTAYAVLCGGTTSTNPVQSIASVGSSTNVLTSNGSSALPTFQPFTPSNYCIQFITTVGNPADSSTYFFGFWGALAFTNYTAITDVRTIKYITNSGTIDSVYGAIFVDGTLASAQNCTLAIRVNNTTDTNLTTTLQLTSATNALSFTGIGLSVSAGDYISLKIITPAWTTNPNSVHLTATVLVKA